MASHIALRKPTQSNATLISGDLARTDSRQEHLQVPAAETTRFDHSWQEGADCNAM